MPRVPEYILGIPLVKVEPGETKIIESERSQVAFNPRRFVIPPEIANVFDVHGLKIKGKDQFTTPGGIPATVFSSGLKGFLTEESGLIRFEMSRMDIGDMVNISVENKNDEPRNFTGAFVGDVVEEDDSDELIAGLDPTGMGPESEDRYPVMGHRIPRMIPVGGSRRLDSLNPGQLIKSVADNAMEKNLEIFRATTDAIGGKREADDGNLYMLGFGSTRIGPQRAANVVKRPQVLFKPKYLYIPPEIAKDVMVVDVKVGKNAQTVAAGEMPGMAFSAPGVVPLKCDVCQVSMDLTVSVRNKSDKEIAFECAVFGPAVE